MSSKEIISHTFPEVLDIITPKRVGDYWFIGDSLRPQFRLFGGQVVAQCLLAAYETVDDHLTRTRCTAIFCAQVTQTSRSNSR